MGLWKQQLNCRYLFYNYVKSQKKLIKITQQKMSLQKSTKFIIRHQNIKQLSSPINIFEANKQKKYQQALTDQTKEYFVVGDLSFKKKYCEDKITKKFNTMTDKFSHLEETNVQTTMYADRTKTEGGYLGTTMGLEKTTEAFLENRQKRALKRYEMLKQKQKRMNYFLRKHSNRTEGEQIGYTITYNRKQIQLMPNPELINLINDNIPEYWQKTLRDNDKRLKQHLRGNPFKKVTEQQMMQTMGGRKKLAASIPKMKADILYGQKRGSNNTIYSTGFRPRFCNEEMIQRANRSSVDIPKLYCEQVLKINYSPASRY